MSVPQAGGDSVLTPMGNQRTDRSAGGEESIERRGEAQTRAMGNRKAKGRKERPEDGWQAREPGTPQDRGRQDSAMSE